MSLFAQPDFDAFLHDISQAFIDEDFELWSNRMQLPFSMVTANGPVTLTTKDAARRNFDLYITAKHSMGLTLVVREPLHFDNCHDRTAIATYRTHLMRANATRITEPYTSSALMHPCPDNVWRMSAILNALGHHHWTGHNPPLLGE